MASTLSMGSNPLATPRCRFSQSCTTTSSNRHMQQLAGITGLIMTVASWQCSSNSTCSIHQGIRCMAARAASSSSSCQLQCSPCKHNIWAMLSMPGQQQYLQVVHPRPLLLLLLEALTMCSSSSQQAHRSTSSSRAGTSCLLQAPAQCLAHSTWQPCLSSCTPHTAQQAASACSQQAAAAAWACSMF